MKFGVNVVMPAYNEEEGITEFLGELAAHLGPETHFTVVNDCSTDRTGEEVETWAASGGNVRLHHNQQNVGHGPSTVTALRMGLAGEPAVIVSVDGDGQFSGADVARLVALSRESQVDVIEGVRKHRDDPFFRRAASAITRILVWSRTRTLPEDANTPLRIYRPDVLDTLLARVPADAMTPNLLISVLVRKDDLRVLQEPVTAQDRRGHSAAGSTWQARFTRLPSRRFLSFCLRAGIQWLSLSRQVR